MGFANKRIHSRYDGNLPRLDEAPPHGSNTPRRKSSNWAAGNADWPTEVQSVLMTCHHLSTTTMGYAEWRLPLKWLKWVPSKWLSAIDSQILNNMY